MKNENNSDKKKAGSHDWFLNPNRSRPVSERALPEPTRLPEKWRLPDKWRAWTANYIGGKLEDPDEFIVDQELQFYHYWRGEGGERALKNKWSSVWISWITRKTKEEILYRARLAQASGEQPFRAQNSLGEKALIATAKQRGIEPKPGESWEDFKVRASADRGQKQDSPARLKVVDGQQVNAQLVDPNSNLVSTIGVEPLPGETIGAYYARVAKLRNVN